MESPLPGQSYSPVAASTTATTTTEIAWTGRRHRGGAERFGTDHRLAEALVCAAARETFEECGGCSPARPTTRTASSETHRSYRESRQALADRTLSFATSCDAKTGLRADLLLAVGKLGDARAERPAGYDTYSLSECCEGQASTAENTVRPMRGGHARRPPSLTSKCRAFCCRRPEQLDSLIGRSVADVLAVDGRSSRCKPERRIDGETGFRVLRLRPVTPGPQKPADWGGD